MVDFEGCHGDISTMEKRGQNAAHVMFSGLHLFATTTCKGANMHVSTMTLGTQPHPLPNVENTLE